MTDATTFSGLHAPSGSALPAHRAPADAPRTPDAAPAWTDLLDLTSELVGAEAIACSDDFFAKVANLVRSSTPIFRPDEYTDRGKWMDGWESRRKRTPGSDWALLRLGYRAIVRGVDIDTAYFTGNHPPRATVELADVAPGTDLADADWQVVLDDVHLDGGSHNWYEIDPGAPATHLRLTIHPDGGVARLRTYGVVATDLAAMAAGTSDDRIDLAAAGSGARAVACNDMYFSHRNNLLLPRPPRTMGEGWETRRRREPGNDWIIVRLGCAGVIDEAIVETTHFKGNFPDRCSLEALAVSADIDPAGDDERDWTDADLPWLRLMGERPLTAHAAHAFVRELEDVGAVTHVRLSIYPDGGVARLRLLGRPD